MAAALQVTDLNPMVGLEGRTSLLTNLSKALKNNPQLFGDDGRPGNMVGAKYLSFHLILQVLILLTQTSLKANPKWRERRVWCRSQLFGTA